MPTTNVPQPTFGPVGFVVPSEPAILAGVQADYVAALGSGTNLALETPQGQLISSETAIIGDAGAQFLSLASQMDPAYSQGRFQDGLGRIYFLTRFPAQPTVVSAICYGGTGVVIPAGSTAPAQDGNIYTATSTGTISSAGTVALSFSCLATGAIPCPANTLTGPPSPIIPGWDSINNPTAGAVGSPVENRQAFEYRRANSVAGNALGVNGAILGQVLAVPGVADAVVLDNPTSSTVVSNGVTLTANSLYVGVFGGAAPAIGQAILTGRPPGTPMVGNTTVTVQDQNPAYGGNGPTYTINYQSISGGTVNATVSIPNTSAVPSNAQALITTAYQNAFSGADGLPRVTRIGQTVYSGRFYSGIAALGSWASNIISLYIAANATPGTATSIGFNLAQAPVAGTITLNLV